MTGNVLLFLLLILFVYLPFKGRTFVGISWWQSLFQSALFIVGSGLLVLPYSSVIFITYSPLKIVIFLLTTICWFGSSWFVRTFGKRPDGYIQAHPYQFVVRFEHRVAVMKYFEIVFQQAQLLYFYFVLLGPIHNYAYKLFAFFIVVVIAHVLNIYLMPDRKAGIFWLKASIPMGICFGPLLFTGNVLVTASVHIMAYIFFISYWMPNGKRWQLL